MNLKSITTRTTPVTSPWLIAAKNPRFILLLLYAFILIRTAWVSDDAYITFRTIDNFAHGYGLTWNISERVQAYTHPLWMFLLSVFYFFSHEIYFTSLFISITISIIVFYLLVFKCPKSTFSGVLAALILIFSKAFVDYSTSGLENPLTNLIITLFFFALLKKQIRPRTLLVLSFFAGLGGLNRLDTILIFIPALIYAAGKLDNYKKAVFIVLIGFIPLVMWELFSLFYYGFIFPNTAYAKLNTGINSLELLKHGGNYLYISMKNDPLTLITITAGGVVVLLKRMPVLNVIFTGSLAYILYIIKIGGDFMSGRFLTVSLVTTILIITQWRFSGKYIKFILLGIVILIGVLSPHPPLFSGVGYGIKNTPWEIYLQDMVCDERGFYYPNTGLLQQVRASRVSLHHFAEKGKEDKKIADAYGSLVVLYGCIGFRGYFAGPKVYIVDYNALSDSLLARLPSMKTSTWRIGHFRRFVPQGYLETLRTGKMQIKDKNIAAYYQILVDIIRGDLLNLRRLKEIIKINCGMYNSLIDRAFWEYPPLAIMDINQLYNWAFTSPDNPIPKQIIAFYSGVHINIHSLNHAKKVEVSLNYNDRYVVEYYQGNEKIGEQKILPYPKIWPASTPFDELDIYTVEVPQNASEKGFDAIRVVSIGGDGYYGIGHLKLLH